MIDRKKQYARQQAWEKENYDRVSLNLPKGKKHEWQERASAEGLSLTEYIIRKVEDGA